MNRTYRPNPELLEMIRRAVQRWEQRRRKPKPAQKKK